MKKRIRRLVCTLMVMMFVMAAAIPALASPKIREAEYEGSGRVDVEFKTDVKYKNVKVKVTDTKGKAYSTVIRSKDEDDLTFEIKSYKKGVTYKYTITGVKQKNEKNYGQVSGKVTSYIEWLNSWMGSWKNETLDQSFSYSTTVVPDTDLQGGAKIDRVASYAPYTSIEDACLGANIYLTKNHNVKLGTTYERLAIPKRIQVNIAYKMDTFASDQPGLSYNGTFTSTTIYGYLTPFNRCDYLRGADMNIKYQYRGNENDNQSYKMVFYGDHNYDWKVWSWDRNTNLVDLTLNGSSTWTVGNPDL